jgi:hypothetical protein
VDQDCQQRCSAIQGKARRVRRGSPGATTAAGGGTAGVPPLSAIGVRLRWRRLREQAMVLEPDVPAEAEGAVDQCLVSADGYIGAHLEASPAGLVFDLLVGLFKLLRRMHR